MNTVKARLIIDSSVRNADMLYKVGVIAPDSFVYFKIKDLEGVTVKALEYSRVKKFANKNLKVFAPEEITGNSDFVSHKDVIKALIKKYNIDCFEVAENFPVIYADFIRNLNVKVEIVEGYYWPERESKNEVEIIHLEEAVRVVERCMKRAETVLKEASVDKNNFLVWENKILTSEQLIREINMEAIKNDATGEDTIAASGINSSQPHNTGSGPIKAGEPIVVDIFPRMNNTGYWGDMTRTFVKGTAPEIVKKAYIAVKEAKEKAKEIIKTGSCPAEAHNLASSILAKHGFETGSRNGDPYGFIHSLGHGVGLNIHEPPAIGKSSSKPFVNNSIITVEPGVYYPEWGGVRLEDMVIVKENGIKCLSNYPEVLEI